MGSNKKNIPRNWKDYTEEIEFLLKSYDPYYHTRVYVTLKLYVQLIDKKPWSFPLLRALKRSVAKRYIAYYLQEQGRVARGTKAKTSVWMLPEAKA